LGQDAYHKVLQRVLNVLCTPSGVEEKRLAVGTLNWGEDSSAAPILKNAMSLPGVNPDPVLRALIIMRASSIGTNLESNAAARSRRHSQTEQGLISVAGTRRLISNDC